MYVADDKQKVKFVLVSMSVVLSLKYNNSSVRGLVQTICGNLNLTVRLGGGV